MISSLSQTRNNMNYHRYFFFHQSPTSVKVMLEAANRWRQIQHVPLIVHNKCPLSRRCSRGASQYILNIHQRLKGQVERCRSAAAVLNGDTLRSTRYTLRVPSATTIPNCGQSARLIFGEVRSQGAPDNALIHSAWKDFTSELGCIKLINANEVTHTI